MTRAAVLRQRAPLFVGTLVVALALRSSVAGAQGNDRSAPTGGRTALMGNTGIALGEDGAAPFMNPSTIVRIHDNSIAFSVNFLELSDTHFSDWHQPGAVDATRFGDVALQGTDISSFGFNALPSTLCLFFTVALGDESQASSNPFGNPGRQKLAFCLGTLESQSTGLPAVSFAGKTSAGTTTQAQSVAESWSRVHAGPTYAIALSNKLDLGLSLHGVYTLDSFSLDGSSITSLVGGGATQSSLGSGGNGHSFDLTAILGATYRSGSTTFGLSGQLVPAHIFGSYSGVLHDAYATGATSDSTLTIGSGSFVAPPPIRLGVGVGTRRGKLTAEADASFDFGWDSSISTTFSGTTTRLTTTGATTTPLSATYTIPSRPVFNASVGGEYFVGKDLSVLGGLSSNLSSLPGLSPTMTVGNLTPERTNWLNASFGLGSYGSAGSILIGAVLGFGWGQAIALNPYVVPNNWAVVDTQSYNALFVLAGAVNVKSVGRAVHEMESVVTTGRPDAAPPGSTTPPAPPASK